VLFALIAVESACAQVSALTWGVGCAVAIVCLALVIARRQSVETHAARAERASRPAALRDAELVLYGKTVPDFHARRTGGET
jgi:hypothetical protein